MKTKLSKTEAVLIDVRAAPVDLNQSENDGGRLLRRLDRAIQDAGKREFWPMIAITACQSLRAAYLAGARNGGSVDWSDVDAAQEIARKAIRQARKVKFNT